ncbi:acetylglutamate kinase [Sporolactobacillus pectinivorans]|uniref:acetylglutamate kinase n=1 Tax=Sporolactobacillus pectinivorans TaxID=1591408 RepID=UPI001EFCA7B0|nr:acetylglutamate kinase [Sporolactobacillus pectinivorans]
MSPQHISMAETELRNHLRLLWEQHVYWTRLTIVGIVFSLPDAELTTNRLLRNPKDFELALAPLYGSAVASQFEKLFTEHLVIAAQLVRAAKAGNSTAATDAEKRWYTNADEIAAFLGHINPYWSAKDWQSMMHEHLALTKTEAVELLTKKYTESVSTFDRIEQQALTMADIMAYGIARQFPSQFPM